MPLLAHLTVTDLALVGTLLLVTALLTAWSMRLERPRKRVSRPSATVTEARVERAPAPIHRA